MWASFELPVGSVEAPTETTCSPASPLPPSRVDLKNSPRNVLQKNHGPRICFAGNPDPPKSKI